MMGLRLRRVHPLSRKIPAKAPDQWLRGLRAAGSCYIDSTMEQTGALRKLLGRLNKGLLVVLKPLQILNNFLFLALAYFIGVGFSSLLYRLGPGKKKTAKIATPADSGDSYWRELPPAPRDKAAWLRPF
jgi:hypothetical protein